MARTQIDGSRQIRDGTIKDAQIASDAAINVTKLNKSVIAADGTQAFTADQSAGNHKITNLLDPTSSQDAATKAYVDATAQGLDVKASVKVATVASGALATAFANGQTVDGYVLQTGDRILIKNQSTGSENGIYTVNASGTPTRATDADTNGKVSPGLFTFVEQGSTNADSGWILTNDGAITVGTTALVFQQFSGAGQITGGAGLTKTGNQLDVVAGDASLVVNADELHVQLADGTIELTAGGLRAGSTVQKTTGFVNRETPTGAINGTNQAFSLASTPVTGSEMVFLNGLLQEPGSGNDYQISGATITFEFAPATGDRIRVTYRK